jgi:hypothetical protein
MPLALGPDAEMRHMDVMPHSATRCSLLVPARAGCRPVVRCEAAMGSSKVKNPEISTHRGRETTPGRYRPNDYGHSRGTVETALIFAARSSDYVVKSPTSRQLHAQSAVYMARRRRLNRWARAFSHRETVPMTMAVAGASGLSGGSGSVLGREVSVS